MKASEYTPYSGLKGLHPLPFFATYGRSSYFDTIRALPSQRQRRGSRKRRYGSPDEAKVVRLRTPLDS
jgi:hypothetical protein